MTSTSDKRPFRWTGTGWPSDDPEWDDLTHVGHVMVYLDAYDDETIKRYVRSVLGTKKGGDIADALPLTPEKRRAIHELFGFDDMEHWPHWRRMNFARHLARSGALHRQRAAEEQAAKRQRTCLYRFHDDADRLLYVGVAYNPDEREKQHRSSQRWAPLIAKREDEWFDSREEALTAETQAIRDESPLFNEAGRPRLPALLPESAA